ncbi:MAG: surface lipoprotein assembly modifier [Gallionella sp.]
MLKLTNKFLGLLAGLVISSSLFAEPLDLTTAKTLLQQGKAAEAYSWLEPFEFDEAGNVEYDYLLGTAALNSGMPGKATLVFERVLAVEPRYVGVRADMARAYFDMGDYARSKIEFETILVIQNLPVGIKEQAEKYIAAIDNGAATKTTTYNGYIDAGFGRDNNVNSSTKQSPILFTAYGVLYFPDATALPKGDNYTSLNFGGEVNHRLGERWSAYGGVDLRGRSYSKYSDSNYAMLDGHTGLSYSEGSSLIRMGLIGGRYFVADRASRDTAGLTGEWRYALDAANQMSLSGQHAQYRFVNPAQNTEDFDQSSLGVGWMHAFSAGKSVLMFNLGTGSERDVRGRSDGGKRYNTLRVTTQTSATDSTGLFMSAGAMDGRFEKLNPNFLLMRKDKLYDATLGASVQIFKAWTVRPQLTYMRSVSNVPFYQFSKTDYSLNLRRDF